MKLRLYVFFFIHKQLSRRDWWQQPRLLFIGISKQTIYWWCVLMSKKQIYDKYRRSNQPEFNQNKCLFLSTFLLLGIRWLLLNVSAFPVVNQASLELLTREDPVSFWRHLYPLLTGLTKEMWDREIEDVPVPALLFWRVISGYSALHCSVPLYWLCNFPC